MILELRCNVIGPNGINETIGFGLETDKLQDEKEREKIRKYIGEQMLMKVEQILKKKYR